MAPPTHSSPPATDLMHEGLGLRDPGAAARFFGNSVQVVKLHGMPAGE